MARIRLEHNGTLTDYDSLQDAINAAVAGDRVIIDGMVYVEYARVLDKTGQEDKLITIEGEDPETCAINGAYVVYPQASGEEYPPDALITDEWVATTLNGLSCYYLNRTIGVAPLTARTADGIKLWTFATEDEFTNSEIDFGIYYDDNEDKVYLRCPDGFDPNNEIIFLSRWTYTIEVSGSSFVAIKGLSVLNGGAATIQIKSSPHLDLGYLKLNGGQRGIYFKDPTSGMESHYVSIHDCELVEKYIDGLWWSDFKQQDPIKMEGSAIYVLRAGTDMKFSRNRIKGFFNGISVVPYSTSFTLDRLVVENNEISDIMDDALEFEKVVRDADVRGNLVYDAFVALSIAPCQGPMRIYRNHLLADKMVNYNRSVGNRIGAPVFKIGGENDLPTKEIYVYNNTLVDTGHVIAFGYDDGKAQDIWFINNILLTKGGSIYYFTTSCDISNLICARNLYYRLQGQTGFLKDWQASFMGDYSFLESCITERISNNINAPDELLQIDPYALNADPKVIGAYCHPPICDLRHDSPAIDAGIDLECLGLPDCVEIKDYPDIGCYEFKKLS